MVGIILVYDTCIYLNIHIYWHVIPWYLVKKTILISLYISVTVTVCFICFVFSTWIAIEAWIIFGCYTWLAIWSGISKSLCGCDDPGPSEINVQFDPNSGTTTASQPATATSVMVQQVQQQQVYQTTPVQNLVVKNDDEQLPPGWQKVFTQDGKPFYQNNITQQTQWEKPVVTATQEIVQIVQPQPEPVEVIQVVQVPDNNNNYNNQNGGEGTAQQQESNVTPLPSGWKKCMTNDGRVYYQNSVTKKTQWVRPVEEVKVNPGGLPSGWKECKTNDGKIYYQNYITKKTQWERPT